jgi:FMN reductase (NADPH)/FMN reductase [NAD(P)H]
MRSKFEAGNNLCDNETNLFTLGEPMNPTLEVLFQRRSVRAYTDLPLAADHRETILQAAFRAPTAGNMMLYSIIEVEDQAIKDRLAETCDHQPFIARAPFLLLFLADYQRWMDAFDFAGAPRRAAELGLPQRRPQEGDLLLAMSDALIAAQNAVIAAESLGVGSCYIGDILEQYEVHREMFNLPRYTLPVTLVCFGYPKRETPPGLAPRYAAEFILHRNQYQRLQEQDAQRMFAPIQERYFSAGNYYNGAQNLAQHFYLRKFTADFSFEMSRSTRAMIRAWCAEEE